MFKRERHRIYCQNVNVASNTRLPKMENVAKKKKLIMPQRPYILAQAIINDSIENRNAAYCFRMDNISI